MLDWLVKKVICNKVNALLSNKDVQKTKIAISLWISRLNCILELFEKILSRLDDNKVDEKEVKETGYDLQVLIASWPKSV